MSSSTAGRAEQSGGERVNICESWRETEEGLSNPNTISRAVEDPRGQERERRRERQRERDIERHRERERERERECARRRSVEEHHS